MAERHFPWKEFLDARKAMIAYLREVNTLPWHEIARTLSCDPEQVKLIYLGTERAPDA